MVRHRIYEISQREAYEVWGSKIPVVKTWLAKLRNKSPWAWRLWFFCKYHKITPEELLALKKDPTSREVEKLLDTFAADESINDNVRERSCVAVKSFFKYNYIDLPSAAGKVEVIKKKPYRKHSKEELLKIYRSAKNPRDRALITFTWSTGIAKEGLTLIQISDLEEDWRSQDLPHITLHDTKLKGHGRGKYKGIEQHTFLTPEAKRDLLDYIDFMERVRGFKFKPEDNLWREINEPYGSMGYSTLTKIARNLTRWSGVPFGWHDARRYLETALEEVKINPNWARKIRGRKVKGEEAPYSRPAIEQLRAKYKEAVPLLEFTQPTQLMELQRRQEIAEGIQSKLMSGEPLTDEDRKNITRYKLRVYKRAPTRQTEHNGGCPDGEHCSTFKQVSEGELLGYLQQGWQIVHRLQSGEVIVKRLG